MVPPPADGAPPLPATQNPREPIDGQDAHYLPYVQAQQEARARGLPPLDTAALWAAGAEHQNQLFGGGRGNSGMDIRTYAAQRGNIGPEGLGWQRPSDEAALTTPELIATRAYARSLETHDLEEVISACSLSIRRYGFACVDHVVPREEVARVKWELSDGYEQQLAALGAQRPRSEIVLQPTFARFLCHPAIVGIAKTMLDAHVRIANVGHRNLNSDDQASHGLGGFEVSKNGLIEPFDSYTKTNILPDRLGTNIGKTPPKRPFFLRSAQRRTAARMGASGTPVSPRY